MRLLPFAILIALSLTTGVVSAQGSCIAPALENFDAATPTFTQSCSLSSPGTLPAGWLLNASSNNAWRVFTGPTGTFGTGPTGDHTSGNGNYLYIESSGCLNTAAVLNSPCFDATTTVTPTVEFWYHMFGTGTGTLRVDYYNGSGWTQLWTLTGDQGDQWFLASVPIPTYAGGTSARFRFFATPASSTSDIAIDDVKFGEPTPPQYQINSPGASLDINGDTTIGFFGPQAISLLGLGVPSVLNVQSTNIGSVFDIALTASPVAVPGAGGIGTPGGQVVNFDPFNPTVFWVNGGGPLPGLGSTFPGNFQIFFNSPPVPVTVTAQMFVGDPSLLDGVAISQAAQLEVVADYQLAPDSVACTNAGSGVPLTDDSSLIQPLGFTFNYYGVGYSDVYVGSNGHCTFGGGLTGWAQGGAALASNTQPIIAYLSEDLNPAAGGNVTFYADPTIGLFEVCVTNVPSYGGAIGVSSNTLKMTAFNGGLITFHYDGAMTEIEGTVGLSPGSSLGTQLPLNLSAAGGLNGPIPIPLNSVPFEDFVTGTNVLDLQGFQVNWALDTAGNPTMVF